MLRVAVPLIFLIPAGLVFGQDRSKEPAIPAETSQVLRQLRDWEFEERTRLEQKIAERRRQVIAQMQRQLESHTKRGDLESANAILAEIEKLESTEKRPPAEMTYELPWEHHGKKGSVLVTFHPDGIATWENTIVDKTFQRGFPLVDRSFRGRRSVVRVRRQGTRHGVALCGELCLSKSAGSQEQQHIERHPHQVGSATVPHS